MAHPLSKPDRWLVKTYVSWAEPKQTRDTYKIVESNCAQRILSKGSGVSGGERCEGTGQRRLGLVEDTLCC